MSRTVYVYNRVDGTVVPRDTVSKEATEHPFQIMGDIKEYRNAVDGGMITSRSHHREFLKVHDLVEIGNEKFPERKWEQPTGLREAVSRAFYQERDRR